MFTVGGVHDIIRSSTVHAAHTHLPSCGNAVCVCERVVVTVDHICTAIGMATAGTSVTEECIVM